MPATSAYASWFRYAEARPPASTLRSLLLPQAAWALSSSKVGPNPADSGGGQSLPRRNGGNATRVALLVVAGFLSGKRGEADAGRRWPSPRALTVRPSGQSVRIRKSAAGSTTFAFDTSSHTGCAGAQRSGRSQRGRASRREGVRGATRFLQESSDGAFAGDDSDFCVSGPTAQRSPSSSASESDGCFWDGLPAGATPRPRLSANQTHATTLIHNSENVRLLNALWMVAGDQARKAEGYVHRGITCNNCSTSPIKGARYKCANCLDYDLCEPCEALRCHFRTHVFLKIRIPVPPLANPRGALLSVFYPGKEDVNCISLPRATLQSLQERTHFDIIEMEALYEQFKSLAMIESPSPADVTGNATGGGICKETFKKCLGPLGLERNLITERIFRFFDQDGDGIINFPELVCGLSVLCKGNMEEKVVYAFKGYDLDGDGYISRSELQRMFKAYFQLNMELVRDVVKGMEGEMMDRFDTADAQGMPVSAAFTAPIPSTPAGGEFPEFRNGNGSSTARSVPPRLDLDTIAARRLRGSPPHTSAPSSSSGSERPPPWRRYSAVDSASRDEESTPTPLPEDWPVMEAMSQEAIDEMVERTFAGIGATEKEGYISFDEFKRYVQTDASIVSWFESLGSVF